MSNNHSTAPRLGFAGPGLKALVVAVLVLAFLIPLGLVQGIVGERRSTRDQAENSIIEPVGGRPSLFGPFLVLPYELRRGRELIEGEIVLLPESLAISSTLKAEERKRGIFSATVLESDVAISGTLTAQAAEAAPYGARLRWDLARLGFELGDLRALAETPRISWGGRELSLRPDARAGRAYAKSISTRAPVSPGESVPFTAGFKLRGGSSLSFLEPAGTVVATMKGAWPSPSFFGYSAPTDRSVSEAGFSARWFMPESSQGMPRVFDADKVERGKLAETAFGVQLLDGVDAYDMSWRATRYGILFIVVPFAVLFLFELLTRSRVHPVQYVLIGLANCLFYLLLLSLSEILGFGWAYAIAAAACSLLCGAYASAALRSRRGFALLPALGFLYAYLYVVISSEDYALLLGSLGLLALLIGAMAATRKVDWYGNRAGAARTTPSAPPAAAEPEADPSPDPVIDNALRDIDEPDEGELS